MNIEFSCGTFSVKQIFVSVLLINENKILENNIENKNENPRK